MPAYLASYTTSRGQSRQIQVQATNLDQARRQLRRRGIRATALVTQAAGATAGGSSAASWQAC